MVSIIVREPDVELDVKALRAWQLWQLARREIAYDHPLRRLSYADPGSPLRPARTPLWPSVPGLVKRPPPPARVASEPARKPHGLLESTGLPSPCPVLGKAMSVNYVFHDGDWDRAGGP